MHRYLAFIRHTASSDREQWVRAMVQKLLSGSGGWVLANDGPGLTVICEQPNKRSSCAYSTTGRGVILGKLFHSRSMEAVNVQELGIVDPGHISGEYWGRYIGFLTDESGVHHVFRDPSAALPCYLATVDRVTIAFSHLSDYRNLVASQPDINWHHLSTYIARSRMVSRETGFIGVTQVLGGECISIRSNETKRWFFWHPSEIYARGVTEGLEEATANLAETTRRCVRAWASCYDRVLHHLSGGLDSSIVLSCFQDDAPQVTCYNVTTEASEGDERVFARKAAHMNMRELIEAGTSPTALPLEQMLIASDIASPLLSMVRSGSEELRDRLVQERGVQALFSGQGGDHLFQRRRDNIVASEFIYLHGVRPRLVSLIAENARMTGHSVWSVSLACVRHGLFSRPWSTSGPLFSTDLLTASAGEAVRVDETVHPWILEAARLPASKVKHLHDVIDCQAFFAVGPQPADLVHPLISQPLIECSLQIPSYMLSFGGRDRGLARRAFAKSLPREVLARETKGGFTSFWHNLVLANTRFAKEFLLDGTLVRAGVLDRQQVEAALSGRSLLRGQHLQHLVPALFAEAWLAQSGQSNCRAA